METNRDASGGLFLDRVLPGAYCIEKLGGKVGSFMNAETRRRRGRFFRLRAVLSPVLVVAGAAILYCGYRGLLRLSLSLMIAAAVVILAGLCLRLTLAFCPFCGARVNLRSGLLLWNYTCPHCHTSVADGGGELRTGPHATASPAAFRRKVLLALLGTALGLLVLLAAIPLGGSLAALAIAAVLLIPSLAVLWTLRCPGCGAWVAKQANVFGFLHFACTHCGFSADGAELEKDD